MVLEILAQMGIEPQPIQVLEILIIMEVLETKEILASETQILQEPDLSLAITDHNKVVSEITRGQVLIIITNLSHFIILTTTEASEMILHQDLMAGGIHLAQAVAASEAAAVL